MSAGRPITSRSLSVGLFNVEYETPPKAKSGNYSTHQRKISSSSSVSLLKGSFLDELDERPTRSPMRVDVSRRLNQKERKTSPFKRRLKSLKEASKLRGSRRSISPLARISKSVSNKTKIESPYERKRPQHQRIVRNDSMSDMTAETDDISVSTNGTSRDRRRDSLSSKRDLNRRVSSKFLPVLSESFHDILESDEENCTDEVGIEAQLVSPTHSTRQIELRSVRNKDKSQQRSKTKQNRNDKLRTLRAKKESLERFQTPPALRSRLSGNEMARILKSSNRSSAAAVKHLEDTKQGLVKSSSKNTSFYSFAYKKIVNDVYGTYVNTALDKFSKSIGYSS